MKHAELWMSTPSAPKTRDSQSIACAHPPAPSDVHAQREKRNAQAQLRVYAAVSIFATAKDAALQWSRIASWQISNSHFATTSIPHRDSRFGMPSAKAMDRLRQSTTELGESMSNDGGAGDISTLC